MKKKNPFRPTKPLKMHSINNQTTTNLLEAILESSPHIIIFALDTQYRYMAFNHGHKQVIQAIWGKEITLGMNMLEVITREDDYTKAKLLFDRAFGGESFMDETHYGDEARSRKFWQSHYSPIYDNNEQVIGVTCFNLDISQRKETEEKLKLFASVFSSAREGIVITDTNATIIDANDAYSFITGYSKEEFIGKNVGFLKAEKHDESFYENLWETLAHDNHWSGEIWNRRKNGEVFVGKLTISAIRDTTGKTSSYVGLLSDITSSKDYQCTLEKMAFYDVLTGLPNRLLLAERITQGIAMVKRLESTVAVCYLDLDGFKPVNDTFGHSVGDNLLIEVARRMEQSVREGDTVARLGGDEFVLVLLNLTTLEECKKIIQRVLNGIQKPYHLLKNQCITVSASIGVTLYPHDDSDADTLLRHADQAMYVAKESGKNRYVFHHHSL